MSEFTNLLKESYEQKADERSKIHMDQWKIAELNRFIEAAPPKGKLSLLDAGSGPGLQGEYLKENGFDVTCIDLSENMVKICREKGLKAELMDYFHMNLPTESFDLIWSMNSLLHVPKKDFQKVIQNLKSILKPNGLFYLGVYGGEDSEGIWEGDHYEPKRFFSFYKNEDIQHAVKEEFELLDFKVIPMNGQGPDYQAMILKKI
ncbi:class I SAM-dependent methyltransferase [Falsibacillus pallidus]|uniref:class I SAM-dependent methyltransferase n=1 Tax=Falsibacillus pallidus TaxID=493781 RepID=UPI003D989BF6